MSSPGNDRLGEQWPLSPLDDLLIHQTPEPVRMMWTSDIRAYDRHWMVGHSLADGLIFVVGGSVYPNLNMAEAYAIVNVRGKHAAIRATRTLGANRADMTVGPIHPSVVHGLREWRFEIAENPSGITAELSWFDTMRQQLRDPNPGPPGLGWPRGRHRDVTAGFEGFGELEGWIEVMGHRIEITRDRCRGTRDRHWGIRNGIGGPDQLFGAAPPRGGNGHQFVNFGDWAIWGDRTFVPLGSGKRELQVVGIDRKFRFEPETDLFLEGVVENTLSSGEVKTIHYSREGDLTAYLRCGFYGGPNGGAPGTGWWQGQLPADRPVEGEVIDVTSAAGKHSLSGLNEHLCMAECDGTAVAGLVQTYDPNARRRCENSIPGWSLL